MAIKKCCDSYRTLHIINVQDIVEHGLKDDAIAVELQQWRIKAIKSKLNQAIDNAMDTPR